MARRFDPRDLPDVIQVTKLLGVTRASRILGIHRAALYRIVNGKSYARWTRLLNGER